MERKITDAREFGWKVRTSTTFGYDGKGIDERELRLCSGLKKFVWYLGDIDVVLRQLPIVGTWIEEIRVDHMPYGRDIDVIESVELNCWKLTVIRFSSMVIRSARERYTEILCSYGEQLQETNVVGLSAYNLQLIVDSCTNLRVPRYSIDFEHIEELQ